MIILDRVNEFERGISTDADYKKGPFPFSVQSNIHYRYSSAEDLIADNEALVSMIRHHREHQVPRLSILDDYYKAKNTGIMRGRRRKEDDKADYRAAHNFAKLFSQFDVGYLTGIPLKIEVGDEAKEDKKLIDTFNSHNDIDALNSELALDVSKYGRAYELQYRNTDDINKIALSNVFETFVVYDTSIERREIAAVRYVDAEPGLSDKILVTVYTADRVIKYEKISFSDLKLSEDNSETHGYKEVPIVEYSSNRFRMGFYEDCLTLIDLYDNAQSDTANYMTDLNDALLVIKGDFDADSLIVDKEANMLLLASGNDVADGKTSIDAGYIYKQYDVSGVEAYKSRIENNMHEIVNVPNLTDLNFAGNQSGKAMEYKLFGFMQGMAVKKRLFTKGLERRYSLLINVENTVKAKETERMTGFNVIFTPNLPKAVQEELSMLIDAGAEFSQETLLGLASFVDSYANEKERISKEKKGMEPPNYDFEDVSNHGKF
ncbi:phage portal protein [Listeria monocytogenes]|nr:phage portal protein [Listeria monocytogenes]EKA2557641.1 phage portal protein [Listeria monocytogenes]